MIFALTGGDISQIPAARRLTTSFAIEWLYLKQKKEKTEFSLQAMLHGFKLRDSAMENSQPAPQSLIGFLGDAKVNENLHVKKVQMNPAEKARRRARRLAQNRD